MRGGPDKPVVDGNLEFRPPSNEGFVEALRTCPRRGGGRRVLVDERGRVPGQAIALDPAARAVRAGHERALPCAHGLRHVHSADHQGRAWRVHRSPARVRERAPRLRPGGQLGDAASCRGPRACRGRRRTERAPPRTAHRPPPRAAPALGQGRAADEGRAAARGGRPPPASPTTTARCRRRSSTGRRSPAHPDAVGRIALTYDDGPNPEHTPAADRALRAPQRSRRPSSRSASWVEREPALAQEVQAAGHAIGNHTFTHPTLALCTGARGQGGASALPRRLGAGRASTTPRSTGRR